jgi:hypothetical protein
MALGFAFRDRDMIRMTHSPSGGGGEAGVGPPVVQRETRGCPPIGHQWNIATHVEDLTPEEIGERAAKAMSSSAGS